MLLLSGLPTITAPKLSESCLLKAQTPLNDAHWDPNPVWEDDFLGTIVNTTLWTVRNDFDHYGEHQVYQTSNVSVSGGNLILIVETTASPYHCNPSKVDVFISIEKYTTISFQKYTIFYFN